ncbi:MAG TPA: acyl-CoA dehydrogenase [Bdellovibrionales bacterium]|nr:MAG: acyl-CoA dehydrogenase [Bdellovibrionales bacterium GWB1_52_6]OFZ06313.1 MAG: acyl-CoA dehydrogenase [Bdellovibrionales bacterium GWA1_52_35]OFZ44030.1 MAG: acyl-CoA dehydrogenase [Bdellovibrionales bacterium GWC1_52_8]HAR42618.1 acyl-CoA dehydrogenase [Bdellovibrionales bacterium]HCM40062.1 acyl-CoA dehydrogenase [Bdellovibrionales bacterium]
MDFQETEIQTELRDLTRKFARKEILPLVEEDEHNEHFRPELIAKLGELGLTGIPVPEDFGGAGMGYQEYICAIEELAAVNTSYAISVAVTGLPQVILNLFGNAEQKAKYIPPLAAGQAIGAFALSEASSGSDAGSLRTVAKKEGNEYILNGTKLWITQGDTASTVMVMARTGGPGTKGVSAFIVEKGTPGFSCGKREKKMGCSISHTMELIFNNCRIPAANLVGNEGDGFKVAMTALDSGRITIAATALGVARGALESAVAHSREREQFGKPIGEFQGVSFLLADMAVQLDAARLLVNRAAWLKDNGLPHSKEAAMAKLFATDMAMKVTTDAVQVLGGSGYTKEFPVERYMREAKVLQIVEGTNQIQRVVIARSLTQKG